MSRAATLGPAVAAVAALALAACAGGAPHSAGSHIVRAPAARRARRSRASGRPVRAEQQLAAVRRFSRLGLPVFCGARRGHLVALTFDDGPGPYTHLVLRELRRAGAHATFFLVARSIARFPALPRRERAVGAIGDHTRTHPFLPALPPAAEIAEIAQGRAAAERAAGPPVDLFRPPYGARTPTVDAEVRREGMVEVLWDVDSEDSLVSPPRNFHAISAIVRRQIRPGSIVLMHDNRGQTVRALRAILPALRRRHLRAVTVPDLLAADPPSPAILRAAARGCGVVRATVRGAVRGDPRRTGGTSVL
jgi:peptidoglycan/xylan/chitin deacetylase (PgdA/CDA1 family)